MSWAVVVGSVIGLAGTAYSVYDQKKTQEELDGQARKQEALAKSNSAKLLRADLQDQSAKAEFGDGDNSFNDYTFFNADAEKKKKKGNTLGFGTGTGGIQV